MPDYKIDRNEGFIIEDYNNAKPFSSFLPGVAGEKGIPMWLYYVNRGQGVSCFGIKDKDGSMMEFYPAYKAYQFTSNYGFRTFIKLEDGTLYEPFNENNKENNGSEKFTIKSDEFKIESVNNGLKVVVRYNTVPNEDYAALIRDVSIENISDNDQTLEILDGMPVVLPFGIEHDGLKELGNTLRAWMNVTNLENNIPFYKLRGGIADSAEVETVEKGHYYFSFVNSENSENEVLKPIVDSKVVFEGNNSMIKPDGFLAGNLDELYKKEQVTVNKVPCGFFGTKKTIKSKEKINITSFIGTINDVEAINKKSNDLMDLDYIAKKREESNELIEGLKNNAEIKTSNKMFDEYMKQNYLDNVLRGGYPLVFKGEGRTHVYHVFSRKHGDLERDYNFFELEPGYYSQGNGNFRDANQNRRSDVLFNPEIEDFNVKMFMNLIQADGYNPLLVKGCKFIVLDSEKEELLGWVENPEDFRDFIDRPYTPGEFFEYIGNKKIKFSMPEDEFLEKMLMCSEQNIEAKHKEGFWIDHWTYNMDLVDTYLAVYPDEEEDFLFNRKDYKYFDSVERVKDRDEKYVFAKGKVRQYNAVDEENEKKEKLIESRKKLKNWVRVENGKGEIYKTNLYEKLLSLAINKFGNMDPFGVGVQMEAGKPGWNDSLNGLPGMFGSGVSETFEIKRIVDYLLKQDSGRVTELPLELINYIRGIEKELDIYFKSESKDKEYSYWDAVQGLKEHYRHYVYFGFDGHTQKMALEEINRILDKVAKKLQIGQKLALEYGKGIYPTYFYYEATKYEKIKDKSGNLKYSEKGYPIVSIDSFEIKQLPYFLEGPARAMKTLDNMDEKKKLYDNLKKSNVYDKELKMYKVCESLLTESYDIGRARIFTPGWLENESVFLHMEYKYLLGLLKAGLYNEFFEDIKTAMIPFLKPEVYGRSPLENSSFIASSANPDKSVHGQGFVARLSGSTAEGLEIRNTMMFGKNPFKLEDGKLVLKFEPIIPEWLFDENDEIGFRFLGKCNVKYINHNRKNTFGDDKAVISAITLDTGKRVEGSKIIDEDAKAVRNGEIKEIVVELE